PDGVFRTDDPQLQKDIWEVRKSGLNIMMSMKDDRKPVSFIEDCAVPLEHLGAYTSQLTEVFEKHGTRGTWYAHASVGCLHVRPVLNLKLEQDARTMRAIAEEAFELVRTYKGAHSGEHGDGLVRSEFHRSMYGDDVIALFETVKATFDPDGMMNPGKIVDPPKMNDRELFRYKPSYQLSARTPVLDWEQFSSVSAQPGAGGLQNAVEMCNNNGACRKQVGGAMCPSYRVTRDETHVTRGRANTLRLALSGQLGEDAFASEAMAETMKLCVSCKACRSECPTGVDMARMKIEVLAARAAAGKLSLHERAVAYLPRYAPLASRLPWLANARDVVPGMAALSEAVAAFAADRPLPRWKSGATRHAQPVFSGHLDAGTRTEGRPRVLFFADTFNRYFEGDPSAAAVRVLNGLGYDVYELKPKTGRRPLCCGRTFLSAGLVEDARAEAMRVLDAIDAFDVTSDSDGVGTVVVGLEPSCLLTLRDEFLSLGLGARAEALARRAFLLEEFLVAERDAGRLPETLGRLTRTAHVHGHCHQKSFGAFGAVSEVLSMIEGLRVKPIESSCCGMAGAFGYSKDTASVSREMGELSLLPAVRAAKSDDLVIADGFSCRHQIADGAGREAVHVAHVLDAARRSGGFSGGVQ
ncbi:MAG: FAD-linked oxidase C-terminal domain-containing protein, partial [Pseudomonadota bacterium]